MVNEKLREEIAKQGYENSIVYDTPSFDDSIVGVTDTGKVAYSYELMVEEYVRDDNPNYKELPSDEYYDRCTEAIEFIDYNTVRGTPYMASYGTTPVIIAFNPDTEKYYDMVSGDEFDLDAIDIKFDDKFKLMLEFEA